MMVKIVKSLFPIIVQGKHRLKHLINTSLPLAGSHFVEIEFKNGSMMSEKDARQGYVTNERTNIPSVGQCQFCFWFLALILPTYNRLGNSCE